MEAFENGQSLWNPLGWLGIENDLLKLNGSTIINTWIVLFVLITLLILVRIFIEKSAILAHLVKKAVQSLIDLIEQNMGRFVYSHFLMVAALFLFILGCNWVILLPWTKEPTTDINTTLALAVIAFFYKEIACIRARGWWGYLEEFLEPFFIMAPINVIGHFSKIISLSFRLFGNIFGSSIIMDLYTHVISTFWVTELLGLLSGLNIVVVLFFGLFEGLIQAFVFAMLTLTYIGLAVQKDHHGESN
ncbi:MAG TPA: F0F1 ATP synthase subunit A [Candidatus Babeliales bacterium]|nr:F0F1 ATP synthase subunit A [Candidatus Babeliales bacterium]